ncbi:hypothetical protein N0V82_003461 [Gnomoniopsis sp. IMI 355080]|nr:hypothetical protein N0V82_003461 [Gnomoniopsis sp. IMI 355080]
MAVPEHFELFFDLPSELREQILGYLLIKQKAIQIKQYSDRETLTSDNDTGEEDEYEASGPRWPLNYFLVSQTFNREATATYFRENVFHVFPKGTKMLLSRAEHLPKDFYPSFSPLMSFKEPRSGDALLLNPAWTPSVRRIRNMVIYIHRLRDFLERSVFQPLLGMILAGGLKNLEFRMGFRSRGESMFSAPPMRCIFRVLTDPDLLVARLSIPARNHAAVWCPFHMDGGGGGDGFESCGISKGRMNGPRSGWLSVDVAALIRRYGEADDHLRILKVGD